MVARAYDHVKKKKPVVEPQLGDERRYFQYGLVFGMIEEIDVLLDRELLSIDNRSGRVRARSSISDGRPLARSRRSNGLECSLSSSDKCE